ncbi:LOW QUALITY PROTEIN: Cytochrome P [Parasponia andersonii]|uniref:Cytochrome P n=1 Tax=Parasponia andersonii TaxID=3476 RepID=A0A2P5A8L7_PARAD|nr:LOW QUALITY PROTEIN: Cytochrome P [Parasponia andersonii]
MKKVRKEINSIVGKNRLRSQDIANLPYIQAIYITKETLRLHPPGPIKPRESSQKCTINGYDIPEKARLLINWWAIGGDQKHWEISTSSMDRTSTPCPLGMEEKSALEQLLRCKLFRLQTSLAVMVQCFEWNVEGEDGIVNMEEALGISLPRAHPLISVPVARLSP